MKKKILFGSILLILSAVFISIVTVATKGHNPALSLRTLGFCFQAQAESSTGSKCNGSECDDGNGLHYGTMTWDDGSITCCGVFTTTRGKKSS